jgi:hypothetical protein
MRADIRFWAAITLIGICALSVDRGLSIVHFAVARTSAHSPENKAVADHAWARVPGVASVDLQLELKEKINPSDLKAANRRREALSAILSIKPLSSMDWLLLSGMQFITDQPMEQVLGPLRLSKLTGPNEGYVMAERGLFGASLWEDLSPDLKRHTAMDLAVEEIADDSQFRPVLSAQPERVRNELRTAILATGLPPKEIERRLGWLGF